MISLPLNNESIGQNVKDMMQKICKDLRHFLTNLKYTYKSHGFHCDPEKFYDAIVKIVTPFQIVGYYWNDIQAVFASNKEMLEHATNQITNYTKTQKKQNEILSNRNRQQKNPQKRNWSRQQKEQQGLRSQNKVDIQMQKQVYRWAKDEIEKGKRIQMVEICKFAKLISKNKYFLGSTGWCANFLNRHPDLKNIIKQKKYQRMDRLIERDYYVGNGVRQSMNYIRSPYETGASFRNNYMSPNLHQLDDLKIHDRNMLTKHNFSKTFNHNPYEQAPILNYLQDGKKEENLSIYEDEEYLNEEQQQQQEMEARQQDNEQGDEDDELEDEEENTNMQTSQIKKQEMEKGGSQKEV